MNQPVIEFSNFSFTYHNADSESLTGIDLIIRKGEFILLTGHSGCGKTTLTRCINGLIPDFFEGDLSGKCRVCGMDIAEHETGEFSPLVGSVFQDPRSQFFTLHVKTEIPFPIPFWLICSPSHIISAVPAVKVKIMTNPAKTCCQPSVYMAMGVPSYALLRK